MFFRLPRQVLFSENMTSLVSFCQNLFLYIAMRIGSQLYKCFCSGKHDVLSANIGIFLRHAAASLPSKRLALPPRPDGKISGHQRRSLLRVPPHGNRRDLRTTLPRRQGRNRGYGAGLDARHYQHRRRLNDRDAVG